VSATVEICPDLEPGTAVGEYVVTRKIGAGGMGEVYAGEQPLIGKRVAIKVLSSKLLVQDSSVARRLLEEARAVNQIRHPNIIDIFSFGVLADGRPYYVMELLEGENLETALERGWLDPETILTLMDQLCRTLQAAHAAGFVHRDLKPENLWLSRRADQSIFLKVLDFGIAKNIGPTSPGLTTSGQVLGTAQYMAPEQALAKPVDARTDIYAIGIILYRVFAGTLPFDHPNTLNVVAKQVAEAPKPISAHRPIPAPIEAAVMRCLAKEPAQRPQSVEALWTELRPGLEHWRAEKAPARATVVSPPVDATVPAAGPKVDSRTTIQAVDRSAAHALTTTPKRKWAISAGIGALVLLVVATLVSQMRGNDPQPQIANPAISTAVVPQPLVAPAADAGTPRRAFDRIDAGHDSQPDSPPSHRPRPTPKAVRHEHGDPIRL
jgi:serine/threonine-protein kinase